MQNYKFCPFSQYLPSNITPSGIALECQPIGCYETFLTSALPPIGCYETFLTFALPHIGCYETFLTSAPPPIGCYETFLTCALTSIGCYEISASWAVLVHKCSPFVEMQYNAFKLNLGPCTAARHQLVMLWFVVASSHCSCTGMDQRPHSTQLNSNGLSKVLIRICNAFTNSF